jgi:ABC-type dipeptide/oligopeptide/nickel transport system permease component
VLIRLILGDAVAAMQAASDHGLDGAMIDKMLGLDAPFVVQYGRWWGGLASVSGLSSPGEARRTARSAHLVGPRRWT